MLTLILFTTSHCHLCEQAIALINELNINKELILVEVADNEKLLTTYGERIPVLQRQDNLAELNWPFNMNDLVVFTGP